MGPEVVLTKLLPQLHFHRTQRAVQPPYYVSYSPVANPELIWHYQKFWEAEVSCACKLNAKQRSKEIINKKRTAEQTVLLHIEIMEWLHVTVAQACEEQAELDQCGEPVQSAWVCQFSMSVWILNYFISSQKLKYIWKERVELNWVIPESSYIQ